MTAELITRAGSGDAILIRRIFGVDGSVAAAHRPSRLVADAHVVSGTDLAVTARTAGIPFLVDPLTHYFQDVQHPDHPWARLPFATPKAVTPADLLNVARRERLAEEVVGFQVAHGATKIIAPYLHIERPDIGWIEAQVRLWLSTRAILDARGESLPVIAVVALGWRCMVGRAVGELLPLWDALRDLAPGEVALAASRSHDGTKPDERLVDLLMLIQELGRSYPVIMWQQGLLGEACVAGGAQGYECGIGWRERCDLKQAMGLHREPPRPNSPRGARPVYLAELGRSVPKATIRAIHEHPALWRSIHLRRPPLLCPCWGLTSRRCPAAGHRRARP